MNRFEFKKSERESFMTDATIIVDTKTGVNYLFVRSGYGAGLTPLLDAILLNHWNSRQSCPILYSRRLQREQLCERLEHLPATERH